MMAPNESSNVTSSRREARVAFVLWLVAMSYSVMYCSLHGYYGTAEELTFVLGFPSWVFWGVLVPLDVVHGAFTWWYAFFYMK